MRHHGTSSSRCQRKAFPFVFARSSLGCTIFLLCCLNLSIICGLESSNASYVDECRLDCARLREPFSCGKFRAVQWLHNLTTHKDIRYGSFRLIRLSSVMEESVLPELPRFRGFESYSKFLTFLRSSVDDMLTRRALVYTVEQPSIARSFSSGPTILDTDELEEFLESGRSSEARLLHKKKKKTLSVILPLLILLKIIKLKLILLPILIGVHFIKKILIIGALAITSILANLKYCRLPPANHHPVAYSAWSTAAETPMDFTATGHEDDGWSQKIDVMATHEPIVASIQRHPYRAYLPILKQQQIHNTV
ncbi:uncharacterized protein LOC124183885 isoform X1 [Neodiprion fabricii]|uniref:uncharacterized protein LOC124183885 isoform X1 n=2 Tax=Neodiprion fabricii TaxID=2872261 RepID=UPI001ED8CE11|nr:uncharacterized protein LOC124183885 isoform X1 [Neodiprion fabricii]